MGTAPLLLTDREYRIFPPSPLLRALRIAPALELDGPTRLTWPPRPTSSSRPAPPGARPAARGPGAAAVETGTASSPLPARRERDHVLACRRRRVPRRLAARTKRYRSFPFTRGT